MFLAYKLKYRNFNFTLCMYAYLFFATYVCWCGALRAVTNTSLFAIFYVCISMSTVILLIVPFFFLYLCILTIYMHTVRFALVLLLTYLLYSFMFFYKYSNSNLLFSHICILTIYVCWALRTLHYLLMCYLPLSCFL